MQRVRQLARQSILGLGLLLVLAACAARGSYRVPEATGDGWEVADAREVGLDVARLDALVADIRTGKLENVHGVVIVRRGKLALEAYFPGYAFDYEGEDFHGPMTEFDRETPHVIASVTKAFTAALVGIAIDEGYLPGVEVPMVTYFPTYADLFDAQKATITLEHLLTMTSGLAWNEMDRSLADRNNDLIRLFFEDDPVAYMLGQGVIADPGTRWYYSGADVNLLGEVIQAATGLRLDAYADRTLFPALGIEDYAWDFISDDVVHASGNLKLRPRDMAKLGYVILSGGVWQGQQVVPAAWVAASTTPHAYVRRPDWIESHGPWYGYQWWLRPYERDGEEITSILRTGWGGQRIEVFPDLDMVVVLTGGNYAGPDPANTIVADYILPAVVR